MIDETGFKPPGSFVNKFFLVVFVTHSMIPILLYNKLFGFAGQTVDFYRMIQILLERRFLSVEGVYLRMKMRDTLVRDEKRDGAHLREYP